MAYPNRLSTVIPAFIAVIRNAATTLADWLCAMISQRQYHPEAYYMCWEAEFGVTSQYGDTKAGSGNFEYGRACCLCRECPQLVEADIRPLNGNSGFAIGRSRCARSSPQCR